MLKRLLKLFPCRNIKTFEGTTYLRRWTLLALFGFRLYLHHFVEDDGARDPHDHPNGFWTFLFWGSYIEHTRESADKTVTRPRRSPSLSYRKAKHAHRIDVPKHAWSLVLMFPRNRPWGFYEDNERWIEWREYLRERGIDDDHAPRCDTEDEPYVILDDEDVDE